LLHTSEERHIGCNPTLAQFIVDERFDPVTVEGDFDKRLLAPEFVAQREHLVTRGWRRLQDLAGANVSMLDYPLPEAKEKYEKSGGHPSDVD
jgi:hypothetical protein